MIKTILIIAAITIFSLFMFNTADIFAAQTCSTTAKPNEPGGCPDGFICKPLNPPAGIGECERDVFGKIDAPAPLQKLLERDSTGAGAISDFLSRLVSLIYIIAAIVLIFMIVWGAFEWLTSGGDKEKLSSAQRRIINAIIGIALFAVAFAAIQVLGTFTGFKFFRGQDVKIERDAKGNIIRVECPDGSGHWYPTGDPLSVCD